LPVTFLPLFDSVCLAYVLSRAINKRGIDMLLGTDCLFFAFNSQKQKVFSSTDVQNGYVDLHRSKAKSHRLAKKLKQAV
jgi:hypothetical protein